MIRIILVLILTMLIISFTAGLAFAAGLMFYPAPCDWRDLTDELDCWLIDKGVC